MSIQLAHTPVLNTDRLILRAPMAQDWPHWRDFAISARARFIGGPYNTGSAWRAFGHAIGHWVLRGYGSFVFTRKTDDNALGMAGPWFPANWPEKEIGWTIWSAQNEGTGIAHEAALAARGYAYDTLNWDGAVSYIDHGNDRSIALAKRLGAILDTAAETPKGDTPCYVYRHPSPKAKS